MPSILMLLAKPFAGDTRVNREVLSLSKVGFAINVLGWNREKGIKEHAQETDSVGIHLMGPASRERNLLSFIAGLPRFWMSAFLSKLQNGAEIIHAHDFDTLPLGFLMAKLRGIKLVYDAHESYADMISDDAPRIVVSIVRRMERFFIRFADVVIASNPKVAEKIGEKDAVIVMNCPSVSEAPFGGLHAVAGSIALRLGYFGSLEPGRFLIEAMEIVSESSKWQLAIGGNGTLLNEVKKRAAESRQIEYLGVLSHADAIKESQKCSAILVMFDSSNQNNVIGAPNRLFEAFFLGVPAIVTKGTLAGEIVAKEGAGFACYYKKEDLGIVLNLIETHIPGLKAAGINGRRAFEREYNWEKQSARLFEAYKQLFTG